MSIDLGPLQGWLDDPNGPVGRDMQRRGQRVVARAKQLAPVDTGRLRASIHAVGPFRTPLGLAVDVVADVNYAKWVHDGRQAGSRMPPPAALAGWARRHGAAGAEFAIARAIANRGVPARPFLLDALPEALR